jgi:hypothetical protein
MRDEFVRNWNEAGWRCKQFDNYFIFNLLSSILYLLSSILYPLSSILYPLFSNVIRIVHYNGLEKLDDKTKVMMKSEYFGFGKGSKKT